MELQVLKIVLWPRNSQLPPRLVNFEPGKINVVTGASQRGKSALIAIVDYCLGANKCTIPVGLIRDKTEWFGLLIKLETRQLLLARREPGAQDSTGDMQMIESSVIEIPTRPSRNCNVDAVKNRLDQLSGLSSLDINPGSDSGFEARASFRDLAAFLFQPQHVIANPSTLFFKADTYEHREKLKAVFPLVLGAVDNRALQLKREQRDLEQELRRKSDILEMKARALEAWLSESRTYYVQAMEYGLLPNAPEPQAAWSSEQYLIHLRRVPEFIQSKGLPKLESGATERAVTEILKLREEERSLATSLGHRRTKLFQMESMTSSATTYQQSLLSQERRTEALDWFERKLAENHNCPFCGQESDSARLQVTELIAGVSRIRSSSQQVSAFSGSLVQEIADMKTEVRSLQGRLSLVRESLRLHDLKNAEENQKKQTGYDVYRFVGRLEQMLRGATSADNRSALLEEIGDLRRRLDAIRTSLDQAGERARVETAIVRISTLIANHLEALGVERPHDPVRLDIRELTLRISSPSGRSDYLWEIGSGANYMGYHVATVLALQQYFVSRGANPVPRFLMLDQPSQVYFPEMLITPDRAESASEVFTRSEDIDRVRKVFETLSRAITTSPKPLQVIVIEHADRDTWEGIPHVNLVERWRGVEALIPQSW